MARSPFSHINLMCPLFIPGNRRDMLAKAGRYSPSAYIPDLEDSVPVANKEEAREVTSDVLPSLRAIGRPVVPRVNSLSTGLTEDDLKAVVGPNIVGISIGKVNSARDISEVDRMVSALEGSRGLIEGAIGILPWLETASAIVNAYEICASSDRVRWVAFGAEDFSADMGINREVDFAGSEGETAEEYGEASLLYARSAVAVAARAADVDASGHALRQVPRMKMDCGGKRVWRGGWGIVGSLRFIQRRSRLSKRYFPLLMRRLIVRGGSLRLREYGGDGGSGKFIA